MATRPRAWRLLAAALVLANAVLPLAFVAHDPARVTAVAVLGAFGLALVLMTLLTARFGFSRIVGLGRLAVWLPLTAYLWVRMLAVTEITLFSAWVWLVMAVNLVSMVIDLGDALRWLVGDRGELSGGA